MFLEKILVVGLPTISSLVQEHTARDIAGLVKFDEGRNPAHPVPGFFKLHVDEPGFLSASIG